MKVWTIQLVDIRHIHIIFSEAFICKDYSSNLDSLRWKCIIKSVPSIHHQYLSWVKLLRPRSLHGHPGSELGTSQISAELILIKPGLDCDLALLSSGSPGWSQGSCKERCKERTENQAVICLTIENTPLSADAVAAVFIKFKNRLADECNHKIGGVL